MKYKIYLYMEVSTKTELKELLCSDKNKRSGCYSKESIWKKEFVVFYMELQTWKFPKDFSFRQKIYHYLNDDKELKLGICPECGNRCKFVNSIEGYHQFCSVKCKCKSAIIQEKIQLSWQYKSEDELNIRNRKIKQTKLIRYGSENFNNRVKAKVTCLERYDCENPMQVDSAIKKSKETCLEKYGNEYYFQSDDFKYKYKETCVERYGCDHHTRNEDVQAKCKQTCLERYGKESYSQTDESKEKVKQTCLERYGQEYYTQSDKYKERYQNYEWLTNKQDKCYQTKKRNQSFNCSKIEDQLTKYFTDNNINFIYQYKSELYPFVCDFYFPDKDLYVEIHGSWTHGNHPFLGSDEDKLLLEKWKSKNTKYYNNAIETWTVRDVKKRETAVKNNLNYLEIFSFNFEECVFKIKQYI